MAEPPSIWLRGRIGGSSGADAARYLIAPPLIQPVQLNSRIAAMARERGWNACKLSSDQRVALVKEVLDSLPKPIPPEPARPRPQTPSEQHARELLDQAHAMAGGTGEYSEGTPGVGAARFDHPRHGR